MRKENLLKAIGDTPMIELKKIIGNRNVHLFAKLEGQNPGGSIKDRMALYMIQKAEERGNLRKGKIILEATSGNTGIAFSMIGAYKGYKVQIIMSEAMSEERKLMIKSFGAELILTDKSLGTNGAIQKAHQLVKDNPNSYWFVDQFNNPDNVNSHYYGIAPEILSEVSDIDYLFAGTGTSGTIMGIGKRFKEDSPKTKIVGIYPPEGYKIQGLQNPDKDFIGAIYDKDFVDERVDLSQEDAFIMARKIAREEGLFVGMSSGAALFAAVQKSKLLDSGNLVVVIPDRGEKYLSTNLFH